MLIDGCKKAEAERLTNWTEAEAHIEEAAKNIEQLSV
jgi:hypothetical protein